ncbi:hypothetical protein BJ085DRAFT_4496, partial [Dimargaris cristalligena]
NPDTMTNTATSKPPGPTSTSTDGSCGPNLACSNNGCCSKFGWCGTSPDHCGTGCQNGPCTGGPNTNTQTNTQTNTNTSKPPGPTSTSTDGSCGPNLACPNSGCCSKFGWCGTSPDHCGTGCQNGPCTGGPSTNTNTNTQTNTNTSKPPGPTATSTDGSCGPKLACAGNACCSKFGWCGTSSDHCGAGCQNGPCTGGPSTNTNTGGPNTQTNTNTSKPPGPTATSTDGSCGAKVACAGNACCSKFGYCGTSSEHCGTGCQ